MCGSVSGGCVESDVYENAREVLETGEPKLLSLRDRRRGGVVGRPPLRRRDRRLRGARRVIDRLAELAAHGRARRALHGRRGRRRGRKLLVVEGGERLGDGVPERPLGQFDELIRGGRNRLLELGDGSKVFAEWYGPPPRLLVYGAVDTAEALARAAKLLGWTVIVADARSKFATARADPERRRADRRVAGRGARAGRARPPDRDRRPHPRRQVRRAGAEGRARDRGVLHRRARLAAEPGAPPRAAARGRRRRGGARADLGPCGLDIGADTQEETALSILAEILAVRAQREGGPLKTREETNPRRGGLKAWRKFADREQWRQELDPDR